MTSIKIFFISLIIDLHSLTNLNFLLYIIEFFGGPLFSKILQSFKDFSKLQNNDQFSGTIGKITIEKNIVKKKLHNGIKNDLINSLIVFEKIIKYKKINIPFYFEEYYKLNLEQLDLNLEKEYSKKLTEIFKNIERIKIINIFESKENYHLSEFIKGYSIDKFLKMKQNIFFEKEIYILLYLSYFLMISNNFFHCDWHYGNFLVDFNENNEVILYILDTGMMGSLTSKNYQKLKILLKTNLLKPEPINIIKFICNVNTNDNANLKNFINKSKKLIKEFEEINYQKVLINIFQISMENKIKVPIVIVYMFQSIIFLNNFSETLPKDILKYSKDLNIYDEIIKQINSTQK